MSNNTLALIKQYRDKTLSEEDFLSQANESIMQSFLIITEKIGKIVPSLEDLKKIADINIQDTYKSINESFQKGFLKSFN